MACPYIYIAPDSTHAPPDPFWTNAAIVPPSHDLVAGATVSIVVTVGNSGDVSPPSTLELYWSDPTTGFAADPSRLIGRVGDTSTWTVPAHTDIPPMDGAVAVSFAWTPPTSALSVNGGHVCLLARTQFNSSPGGGCANVTWDAGSPQTDPHSGIHNIQVVTGAPKRARFYFAFAATNTSVEGKPGYLHVRVLDPKVAADRARLEGVLFQPSIEEALRGRGKVAVPKGVQLALGRESVLVPQRQLVLAGREASAIHCPPRLGNLGVLTPEMSSRLLAPGQRFEDVGKPRSIDLAPGESRQTILEVIGEDHPGQIYVVEVEHRSATEKPIGGLTFVFVTRPDFF